MKKRGISAVVATVLIILIVVVGVGIVWKVILPIFQELEYLSYSDVQLKIVRQGFTVYDPGKNFAFVQIERGEDDINMTGIEIGFNFDGTTKTYQSDNVPTPNRKYTYKFNFTNDSDMGIPQNVTPDKVTVAPIFTINNKVRLGKILDSEDMPVGRIHMSAEEWEKANNDSKGPVVVKPGPCGDCPGVSPPETDGPDPEPVTCEDDEVEYNGGCAIKVTDCMTLDQKGENYVLTKDISGGERDACILISVNDTTFDGQGHTINVTFDFGAASGSKGAGIAAEPPIRIPLLSGITIKNATITNAKSQGIYFGEVIDSTISHINSSNSWQYHGVGLYSCKRILLENNIFNDNPSDGFTLFWGGTEEISLKNNQICNNQNFDLNCGPGTHIDLGGNTYGTEDCDSWLQPSAGICPPTLIPVTECGTGLDQEGGNYFLPEDLYNDKYVCLKVLADDVSLDMGGNKIYRASMENTGIRNDGYNGFHIYNGIFENLTTSITLMNSKNNNFEDLEMMGGAYSIWSFLVDDSSFSNIIIRDPSGMSPQAIYFYSSERNNLTDINIMNSADCLVMELGNKNTLRNIIATGCSSQSINFVSETGMTIQDSTFCSKNIGSIPGDLVSSEITCNGNAMCDYSCP